MSLGSCFARHIGRALKKNDFNFLGYEPAYIDCYYFAAPPDDLGYGLFSARYGNLYTVRQLRQLFLRAFGSFLPVEEFRGDDGSWFDPFRPTIEPFGYHSRLEAVNMRAAHLAAVRRLFEDSELMIFTMGLTEAWRDKRDGAVYPMCPGTVAGVFDANKHEFINFSYKKSWKTWKG